MISVFATALWLRLPSIRHDFLLIPLARETNSANWVSGRAPGETMIFSSPPVGRITGGWILPPGEFQQFDPDAGKQWDATPWHVFAILTYFNKSELRSLGAAAPR